MWCQSPKSIYNINMGLHVIVWISVLVATGYANIKWLHILEDNMDL